MWKKFNYLFFDDCVLYTDLRSVGLGLSFEDVLDEKSLLFLHLLDSRVFLQDGLVVRHKWFRVFCNKVTVNSGLFFVHFLEAQ